MTDTRRIPGWAKWLLGALVLWIIGTLAKPFTQPVDHLWGEIVGHLSSAYDDLAYDAAASGLAAHNSRSLATTDIGSTTCVMAWTVILLLNPGDTPEGVPFIGWILKKHFVKLLVIIGVVMVGGWIVGSLQAATYTKAVGVEAIYKRRMLALSGLISQDDTNTLNRQWANIHTKDDYNALHKHMNALAAARHIKLPEYYDPI